MKESKLNFIDHSLRSSPLLLELNNDDDDDDYDDDENDDKGSDDDDDDDTCFAIFVARQDGVTNRKARSAVKIPALSVFSSNIAP